MFGYKVVGVTDNTLHSSVLIRMNPFHTIYKKGEFVSNVFPLWYFSTLKEAEIFVSYTSFTHIQIWKCEVLESRKIVRYGNFDAFNIRRFWKMMESVKTLKETPKEFICIYTRMDSYTRVAEQIKLTNLILDITDAYKFNASIREKLRGQK